MEFETIEFPMKISEGEGLSFFTWLVRVVRGRIEKYFALTDAKVIMRNTGEWLLFRIEVPFNEKESEELKGKKSNVFTKACNELMKYFKDYYRHMGIDVTKDGCFAEIWFNIKELKGEEPQESTVIMCRYTEEEGKTNVEKDIDKTG